MSHLQEQVAQGARDKRGLKTSSFTVLVLTSVLEMVEKEIVQLRMKEQDKRNGEFSIVYLKGAGQHS